MKAIKILLAEYPRFLKQVHIHADAIADAYDHVPAMFPRNGFRIDERVALTSRASRPLIRDQRGRRHAREPSCLPHRPVRRRVGAS
jgi:hypothetical protein